MSSRPGYIYNVLRKKYIKLPKGVTFRLGRESDYNDIYEMSVSHNIMNGWDYLPPKWKEWVNHPHYIFSVAEKDGKVIAVDGIRAGMNGGKDMNWFGSRVHNDYKGLGLFPANSAFAHEFTLATGRFNKVRNLLLTNGTKPDRILEANNRGERQAKVVYEGKYMYPGLKISFNQFQTAAKVIDSLPVKSDSTIKHLSRNQVSSDIFSNNEVISDIFPSGHVGLHHEGLQICSDTVDDICHDNRKVFVTNKSDKTFNSLSFGTGFPCTVGTGYNIECFGNMDDEMQLIHMKTHFKEIPAYHQKHGGRICIYFSIPMSFDLEPMYSIFRDDLGLPDEGVGIQLHIATREDFLPKSQI